MPHDPYEALYIHIPFCASKCHYCDFDSLPYKRSDPYIREYVEGLVGELRSLSRTGELASIRTIYIGGGTPTHAGSELISLLYALSVTLDLAQIDEFTVEATPESLDEQLVKDMWALGANRLSIGVQSFDDEMLASIGRIHTSDDAKRAIEIAQSRFENVSVDLMCGLPGQTLEGHLSDVSTAISSGVKHLSAYALSLEKGTKLYKKRRCLDLPDEDAQADMMEGAQSLLESAGFARYEVSNHALPGYESAHNIAYWSGVPYIGLGRSAVTMTQDGTRRMRVRNSMVEDDLDVREMAAEDAMLAMRMAKGLGKERIQSMQELLPDMPRVLERLVRLGLVEETDDAFRPTQRGWLLGNELFGEMLSLAS